MPNRPPRLPANYRRPTPRDRNLTADDLLHNRRLGWLLSLLDALGTLPAPGTPIEDLVDLVLTHLPDDFPTAAIARQYVVNEQDRDLATQIAGQNPL